MRNRGKIGRTGKKVDERRDLGLYIHEPRLRQNPGFLDTGVFPNWYSTLRGKTDKLRETLNSERCNPTTYVSFVPMLIAYFHEINDFTPKV